MHSLFRDERDLIEKAISDKGFEQMWWDLSHLSKKTVLNYAECLKYAVEMGIDNHSLGIMIESFLWSDPPGSVAILRDTEDLAANETDRRWWQKQGRGWFCEKCGGGHMTICNHTRCGFCGYKQEEEEENVLPQF